ncbi:probable RNA-binding protein 19 [Procambarus clarkii]|uniref:probable RNA-binding protein 19 n=1 Tax=Procambarus clarkii TaxID=6728 RepID=UPI001E67232B|nr:probable RNA-binding protein 19 [Procambarus clarkii]
MSRLIIKNLPKQITEDDIKTQFSLKGNITDVKLKYKNGEFRRFGFIGYEKHEDAQAACNFFNNTFIKQSRVTVEICQDYGSDQKPVSWSEKNKQRKSKDEKKLLDNVTESEIDAKKKNKKDKQKSSKVSLKEQLLEQYEADPEFKEFLSIDEKGLSEGAINASQDTNNESVGDGTINVEEQNEEGDKEKKLAFKKNISDLDYLKSLMKSQPESSDDIEGKKIEKEKKWKEFHTVVIRARGMCKSQQNTSRTFTKKSVKTFLKPLKYKSLRIPKNIRLVAYVGFGTEKEMKQALMKDKSFLDGVQVHIMKYEKPPEMNDFSQNSAPWSATEEKVKNAEPVAESGKIFVRNLWYSITEDDLRELFVKYGEISDISLPICKFTRRPKGFATVTFLFPEHAVRAMTELDGTTFKGRLLHILPGVSKEEDEKSKEGMSFKDKKAKEQKATAGSWHNWNTLFMGSSAVIDVMAEKYNKSKQEILYSEGKQSVAVNLALGEAQIVDETKRFLEDNGISLEAFSSPGVQRSSTIILVKNLPAKTTASELSEIFGRYGELGRVVLPPAGVSGVIEYLDPGEAKKAFRNLAYSKFKYSPLYLEWAPIQVFKTDFTPKQQKENIESPVPLQEEKAEEKDQETTGDLPNPEPSTTVYVKNINFATTEEVLKQHFQRVGPVHSVLIAKRRGLSQGYGFVQFLRRTDAQKALRNLNDTPLEDHTLQVKLSEKTLVTELKSTRRMHDKREQTSSKIMVKNIPFQATHKEVRQLFATFGELKSVRLPSKPGSSEHRGFGFVDYISKEDAKKAFEALGFSTHLYDRRLVLEWAKDDESVEELRKKTAEHFLAAGPAKKKTRLDLDPKATYDNDED